MSKKIDIKIPQVENSDEAKKGAEMITDVKDLASYNWLDEDNPTILVPGIPPIWSPPGINPRLKPDTGTVYVDQNTDRNPWSPLEPLVRAVLIMQPDFDFGIVNIITDRRPLRKIYDFIGGKAEDFEFGVDFIGNTALFVRMEKETRQIIPVGAFQGYRHSFEEAYTKLSAFAKGSTSHHRIIQYSFGGFQILVRSAFDAFFENSPEPHKTPSKPVETEIEPDDVVGYMKAASLGKPPPPNSKDSEPFPFTVLQGGKPIPHHSLIEFTTRSRSSKRPFNIDQKLPDLWISQTPNFIEAIYRNTTNPLTNINRPGQRQSRNPQSSSASAALFDDIRSTSLLAELKSWEERNADTLRKLALVIRRVLEVARGLNGPCVVRGRKGGVELEVSRVGAGEVPGLPGELRELWSGGRVSEHWEVGEEKKEGSKEKQRIS